MGFALVVIEAVGQQRNILKDSLQLEEVVIAASKFEQQKRALPFQIEQVTARQIAFRNPQNSADLLMQTGQVFVQKSQGGGGSPVLRGFEANRVLLVIDGVRMNNAIYRAGHLQNALRIDPALLERVEIVMGPSSVVYGSEALGGVMHFRTRNPALSNTSKSLINAHAYARYSSANEEKTGHFDLNWGHKKWGILTSLTYAKFGDLRQGNNRRAAYPNAGKLPFYAIRQNNQDVALANADPNLQVGSGYVQTDFYTKVLFQPRTTTKHTLNVQYSTTSNVPRYDRLTETANNLPRFTEWYYGPEKRLMLAYHAELTRPTALYDHLMLTAAYQDIEESRISRRFGNNVRTSQLERVKVYTFNVDVFKKRGKYELKYGAEAMYNDVHSAAFRSDIVKQTTVPSNTRYPDGGSQMRFLSVYFTNQLNVSEKLFLNAGLRYNAIGLKATFIDKTFFPFPFSEVAQTPNALSGNVGLVYSPNTKTKLSALFSTGFKAPNVDDLAKVFDSQPGSVIVPNPNLRSEFTYNYEVSASRVMGQVLKLEGTFFYTDLRNAITTAPFSFNGQSQILYAGQLSQVTANQNRRRAFVQGGNVAATVRFTKKINLYSTYNQTIGRIKEEKTGTSPLDHIPPSFGRTSLIYSGQKLQAEFFVMYNGWKRLADYKLDGEDNQQYATADGTPPWTTINLRASYELSKNWTIQAACENLTDQNYRYFASGISAPGRNLMLTLRART